MSITPTLDYKAEVVADSTTAFGTRLTTLLVTFPRDILPEFMTHRVFSRNSGSARAMPSSKMIEQVLTNPYIPRRVGRNKPGMQASEYLTGADYDKFVQEDLVRRDRAVYGAYEMLLGAEKTHEVSPDINNPDFKALAEAWKEGDKEGMLNLHKQNVNRQIAHWQWNTTLVTSTEWENFIALRDHEDADPSIQPIAPLMREALDASIPNILESDDWHAPFLDEDELFALNTTGDLSLLDVSAGRCARLSYLTHYGKRDLDADISLATHLRQNFHMSPFEHVATPLLDGTQWSGNFRGWFQYRKSFMHESNFGAIPASQ